MTLRTIGKYELLEEIGRGGFAVVYRARDTALDRIVALKVLHPHWVTDPQFATRFRQEARAAANLRHPNIVTVHDTGEADGQLYIAMAYLPGRTLQDLLEEQGALSLEAALPILEQLADALDYAHGQGVIHRDVKPLNVLVEDTTRGPRATLMDFGLVKALESSTALTSQGTLLGSPEYMAPEQADPNRHAEIGPATDRYALGIVAYRMLTGRVPFEAENPLTVLRAHADLTPPDPRHFVPNLSPAITATLLKMLAKMPSDRFQTAEEFVAQLRGREGKEPLPIWYWLGAGGIVLILLVIIMARVLTPTLNPPPITPTLTATSPVAPTATLTSEVTSTATATTTLTKTPTVPPTTIVTTPTITPSNAFKLISPADNAVYVAQERNGIVFKWDWILKDQVAAERFDVFARDNFNDWFILKGGAVSGEDSWDFRSVTGTLYWRVVAYSKQITYTSEIRKIEFRAGQVGDVWTRSTDDMVMVYVPGGTFQMGSDSGENNERPVHSVTLGAFWLDQTEVTNAQYTKCVSAGTCVASRGADNNSYNDTQQPVVYISWEDAQAYCAWAGVQLPTEAQWEYAARGTEGHVYPWGNDFDGTKLNYCEKNCTQEWAAQIVDDGYELTAPVGSFPESKSWAGALDMAGNVWEWTADWYGEYSSELQTDPEGPAGGENRVVRGGSWWTDNLLTRTAYRGSFAPAGSDGDIGFRCVVVHTRD